jgi:hypothetical protein
MPVIRRGVYIGLPYAADNRARFPGLFPGGAPVTSARHAGAQS